MSSPLPMSPVNRSSRRPLYIAIAMTFVGWFIAYVGLGLFGMKYTGSPAWAGLAGAIEFMMKAEFWLFLIGACIVQFMLYMIFRWNGPGMQRLLALQVAFVLSLIILAVAYSPKILTETSVMIWSVLYLGGMIYQMLKVQVRGPI